MTHDKGEKSMTVNYFIYKKRFRKSVQVCQQAFLNTLLLSKNRVNGVVSRYFKTGEMPIEH